MGGFMATLLGGGGGRADGRDLNERNNTLFNKYVQTKIVTKIHAPSSPPTALMAQPYSN